MKIKLMINQIVRLQRPNVTNNKTVTISAANTNIECERRMWDLKRAEISKFKISRFCLFDFDHEFTIKVRSISRASPMHNALAYM